MEFFYHFGRYIYLMKNLFSKPESWVMYKREIFRQMNDVGVGSLAIISIISLFIGAVTTLQIAYQLSEPLVPITIIGAIVGETTILELAPTISCLVLAGKIGSNMASEIATMRVTEQVDAMEVMGVNVKSFLITPKVLGAFLMIPILVVIAGFLGVSGGVLAGASTDIITVDKFMLGAREFFKGYTLFIMVVKSFTNAFIIASISCYQGFYVRGGALEVGASSTRAVVYSCILILFADFLISYLFL